MRPFVYADTSFLYAWAVEDDPNHDRAMQTGTERGRQLRLTTCVFSETMSLLTKRRGKPRAPAMGRRLFASPQTHLIYPTHADFADAWDLFGRYPDWDFDLLDAISFAVMHREGIQTALTFDRHFAQMGFVALPA